MRVLPKITWFLCTTVFLLKCLRFPSAMNIKSKVNLFLFSIVYITTNFIVGLGTHLENHCQDERCQTLYYLWLFTWFLYLIVSNTAILWNFGCIELPVTAVVLLSVPEEQPGFYIARSVSYAWTLCSVRGNLLKLKCCRLSRAHLQLRVLEKKEISFVCC